MQPYQGPWSRPDIPDGSDRDAYQSTSENESGWETGEGDTTSTEDEEEYDNNDSSSSEEEEEMNRQTAQELRYGGVASGKGSNRLGDPEDASFDISPESFGRVYPKNEFLGYGRDERQNDERKGILEDFQDEPPGAAATSARSSSSTRTIRSATVWMTRRCGLALLCYCTIITMLLLIIGISMGVVLSRKEKDKSETKPQLATTTPIPTLSPTLASPGVDRPSISLPPIGPSTVEVAVSNDGYVVLGGLYSRDAEFTLSTTLLVQDGYQHKAALSIIEFNTSSTLANSFMMDGWLSSAIITLNVASAKTLQAFQNVSLYVRAYPNDEQTSPAFDINQYRFGGLDFDNSNGWIPFEVANDLLPYHQKTIDIDLTDFFLEYYLPTQDGGDWDNIKILIVHDNSDGPANKGATVELYSSEATTLLRPKLTLQLEPPDANNISPSPSARPSHSLAPTESNSPSRMPSVDPTFQPSSSWSPTYHPTVSPAPTITSYPICSLCGSGGRGGATVALVNPKAKVNLGSKFQRGDSSNNLVTCGSLQERGWRGEIPPRQCQRYQSAQEVLKVCCQETLETSFRCDLCPNQEDPNTNGQWGVVVNPNVVVTIPLVGEVKTCQQYQSEADAGQISASICSAIQPYTTTVCCTPAV